MYYILIIIVLGYMFKRYNPWFPTLPVYCNNEADEVLKISKSRTRYDEDFFKLTDLSVIHAFRDYGSIDKLNNILAKRWIYYLIMITKHIINRPRPYQINKHIKYLQTKTGHTPAMPSGHAFQSYYLSHVLKKEYPNRSKELDYIAKRCDITRVKAGIHYPSDGKLSKDIIDFLIKMHLI